MKKLFFISIISFWALNSLAQHTDLPTDNMEVVSPFKAATENAQRITVSPSLPAIDTVRPAVQYETISRLLKLTYDAPDIKPVALKTTPPDPGFNGYVKASMGYPIAPFAEAGYNIAKERFALGAEARYEGLFNDMNLQNQTYQRIGGLLNGTYFSDLGFEIGADVGYRYDRRRFFSFLPENEPLSLEEAEQYFSTIDVGLGFKNTHATKGDIFYDADVDFYSLRDNFQGQERGLESNFLLGKYFGGKHKLSIDLGHEWVENLALEKSLNVVSILPTFTYHHNKFRIKAGVNTSMITDPESYTKARFRFFPEGEILVNLLGKELGFFARTTGKATTNSFRNLAEENPFIVSNPDVFVREQLDFSGGLKGDFDMFDFLLRGTYRMVDQQHFFIHGPLDNTQRFYVIYDDADFVIIEGKAGVRPIENLETSLGLTYTIPTPDNLREAYHYPPTLLLDLGVGYYLLDKKLRLGADLYVGNTVPTINLPDFLNPAFPSEPGELPAYADVNLSADYKVNKKFNAFLHLNNITNQKYYRWDGYEKLGIQVVLGGMMKF